MDLFLDHSVALGRSPTTMREYRRLTETTLRPELGHIKLSKLTAYDLDRLYDKLTAKGNRPITVRHVHSLISAALRQGERWDLVSGNVSLKATAPSGRVSEVAAPSPDEVLRMVSIARMRMPVLGDVLLFAALTGARRGEMCALRWTDVAWQDRTVCIARSVYSIIGGGWAEKDTKSHRARRIGLDAVGVDLLRQRQASAEDFAQQAGVPLPPGSFVFSPSPGGAIPFRPGELTRRTKAVARLAMVDTHLHAFRHFLSYLAIAAGFDVVGSGQDSPIRIPRFLFASIHTQSNNGTES